VRACQRHDMSYAVAVEYRAVDGVAASPHAPDHETTAWQTRIVGADETSVRLNLSSRFSYQVLVKSRTSVEFNTSLPAQPLYVSTYSRSTGKVRYLM